MTHKRYSETRFVTSYDMNKFRDLVRYTIPMSTIRIKRLLFRLRVSPIHYTCPCVSTIDHPWPENYTRYTKLHSRIDDMIPRTLFPRSVPFFNGPPLSYITVFLLYTNHVWTVRVFLKGTLPSKRMWLTFVRDSPLYTEEKRPTEKNDLIRRWL